MNQDGSSTGELRDVLDLVEENIHEVEEVLWITSGNIEIKEYSARIDQMTLLLWKLQHEIDDLKTDLDSHGR